MKNNYFNIAVVSGGMVLGGIFNYLYHPFMLQFMSLEDFGTFGSMMSIFNLVGVIATGVILFLNKEVSKNITNISKIKFIYITMLKYMFWVWCILFLLFVLLSPMIASYLNISGISYLVLVGSTIVISLLAAVIMAILRGMKKYEYIGFYQALWPILKMITWVILVYLWYNIYGAIWWVILSGILWLGISLLFLRNIFKQYDATGNSKELLQDFHKNKESIFQFFIVSLFFAVFMNIDVILAKNIFSPTQAGAYAAIAVLGKFLIFLMLSTETVYYGQVMEYSKKTVPKQLIINPLMVLSIIAGGAIFTNLLIGDFVLSILKSELTQFYYIYILSLFYYGLLAYISFFSKILVGWDSHKGNIVLWLWTIGLIISIYTIWSASLEAFVYCFITVGWITTMALGYIFYSEWKK